MATQSLRLVRAAVALVSAHAGIVIAHGVAQYAGLHIILSTSANVFVGTVIGIAPILGVVLLIYGSRVNGAGILAVAMAASLLRVWNHFVVQAGDHVAHIPGGPWRLPFHLPPWAACHH